MKIKHRLLLAVATLATVSSSASVVVRLAPGGIVIHCDTPNLNVTLDWPRMRGDDGERVAKVEALGDREASLSYTSGTKLVLILSEDGSLSLHTDGGTVSDRDKGILFTLGMPTDLARRGIRWAFDDAEARPLPTEKLADAFLWRADAEALKLTDAEGRGVSIGIPRSWVQLQDNRHWNNNQSFLMKSFGDLPRDGRRSFAIRALGEGGSLQIGTATPLDPHAYRPYPEPKEELWPGHGPIRTFGWQDGIRRRYHARRLQDENAVFFIGDSLTENWGDIHRYIPGLKIANRGLGGDTSRGMRWRLFPDVLDHKPAALVILAGANDLTAHGDPAHAAENIAAMVDEARKYEPRMPVFIGTVPESSQPTAPLKPGALADLNARIRTLAIEKKVALFDLHDACLDAEGRQDLSLYRGDRLHLGDKGYRTWATLMEKTFAEAGLIPEPGTKIDLAGYKIVFEDNFDGTDLDATKWDVPEQNRQDASLWRRRNVSVADGNLRLAIRRTDDPHWRYESAGIRTGRDYDLDKALYKFTYGYVEARLRLPRHLRSDYWVGFWLLAGDMVHGRMDDSREACEIDILETFDTWNLGRTRHSVHWGGYGPLHNAHGEGTPFRPALLDDQFHTFGLLWEPDRYVFTIDGEAVWSTDLQGLGSDKDGKHKSKGVCHKPAYVKLSVEAAPWSGPFHDWEKEMPAEDELLCDYIRVWQR